MEIEIIIAIIILFALVFLATIDMAFSQLSDVSLRRLTSDTEEDVAVNTPFMHEIMRDRSRFRFALSATIQILLIVFSILITLIVYNFFPSEPIKLLIISMSVALVFSGIFRQIIPRFLTWRNPEGKLLFLLPFVRPIYSLMSFAADPFARFLREKDQQNLEVSLTPNQIEEKAEDNAEDFQALMEVGEAEGILEENERELI
ncbi:MAG TPA: CNNM domain-containing protein, partial [Pyrinomonadaceae bacterium]|nr:CNNM domain-containing protein [Pyrinomonadaceae bacterium]